MSGFERKEPGAADAHERVGRTSARPRSRARRRSSATAATSAPPALLQLQRPAGNRAVESMLSAGRRMPAGGQGTRREIARRDEPRAPHPRRHGRREPVRLPPRPGAVGAALQDLGRLQEDAVTIESSDFTAKAVSALYIKKGPTRLGIGSGPNPAYTAKGKVKIDGDPDEVAQYEVGFLQTVFESNRDFYYSSKAEPPGKGAKKMTDYTKTQPGRDGDTGFEPWYGPETVFPFAKKASDTQSTRMDDTPSSGNPGSRTSARAAVPREDGRPRHLRQLARRPQQADEGRDAPEQRRLERRLQRGHHRRQEGAREQHRHPDVRKVS